MGLNNPGCVTGIKLPPSSPGIYRSEVSASSSVCVKGCYFGKSGSEDNIINASPRRIIVSGLHGMSGCGKIHIKGDCECYPSSQSSMTVTAKNEDTLAILYTDTKGCTCGAGGHVTGDLDFDFTLSFTDADTIGIYISTSHTGAAYTRLYERKDFVTAFPLNFIYEIDDGGGYILSTKMPLFDLRLWYSGVMCINPSFYIGNLNHPASNVSDGNMATYWEPVISDINPYIVRYLYPLDWARVIKSVWFYMINHNIPAQVTLYGAAYINTCLPSYTELTTKTLCAGWNCVSIIPANWYFTKAVFNKQIRLVKMLYEYL